ncbi:MAG TPA: VIT1/CCC1 transporter family protein [Acidimicrobiia bacterium]|nr:VIT1/CCC1 transporter family protein [Acidimicrobiia bacterium]
MSDPRQVVYEPHVGASRQYWRDMILGVNDGLVSMLLLVAGVVGGGLDRREVLVTAVAGAIAGAVSMAAGEYLATKSQSEVLESEIDLEKTHIEHFRNRELAQLYQLFREIGIEEEDLPAVVRAFSRDDQTLLNAMKIMEFGMVDSEERSPIKAMLMSGGLFFAGSVPSVAPFLFDLRPHSALFIAAGLAAVALFAVGVVKTFITRGNPIIAGLENLAIAGLGGAGAYLVGRLVGVTV